MSDDLDMRRRRALWRASHRGTKELDLLVGRFAGSKLPGMRDGELAEFEEFLKVQDPELQEWLLGSATAAPRGFGALIAAIRRFHGLS
jgi:antitoxin CptB